jgi:hypothetical protein
MSTTLTPDRFFFSQLGNYWQILAIKAACELSLPDYFNEGPQTAGSVAAAAGLNPDATFRLLRALAECGVFRQTEPGKFEHTERSHLLRSDLRGSFKWMVLSEIGEERVPAWMNLPEAVRSGAIAWDHAYQGKDIWEYYKEHPQKGEYFARWMTGASHAMIAAIHQAFDFSPYPVIVDVGGGQGAFLASIMERYPACCGVLFDQPAVVASASLHPRVEASPGDFFVSVPENGDLYTLKWVIHDWETSKAVRILENVRKAMKPEGTVMMIESIVSENETEFPDMVKWMDINMMVMTGGCERTEAEHRALLHSAGLQLDRIVPTASFANLLIASPR